MFKREDEMNNASKANMMIYTQTYNTDKHTYDMLCDGGFLMTKVKFPVIHNNRIIIPGHLMLHFNWHPDTIWSIYSNLFGEYIYVVNIENLKL